VYVSADGDPIDPPVTDVMVRMTVSSASSSVSSTTVNGRNAVRFPVVMIADPLDSPV